MTTNNEAFENFIAENRYRQYVFQADKDDLYEMWQAATTEANKRTAELESEVAELKEELDDVTQVATKVEPLIYERVELQASNNRLRESLEKIKGYSSAAGHATYYTIADTELSANPTESLQAFKNELIEKCAKACDHVNNQYADIFKETKDTFNDGASYGADDCAEVIRALKEVK